VLDWYREQVDDDGLRLITGEAIIWELWSSDNHAMSIVELTKAFELDKKVNADARRFKFRQLIADITYIRNDPRKGFTLVLKKRNYPRSEV